MNIFVLDENPVLAARMHCDKHVVKMILESAQLLCTAHRVIDGTEIVRTINGRKQKVWALATVCDELFYKATHINHPCSIWVRESSVNYSWLFALFAELCAEYTRRYGKTHACWSKFGDALMALPRNIPVTPSTPFAQAMPDQYKCPDAVWAYRAYYLGEKTGMLKYTNAVKPHWVP